MLILKQAPSPQRPDNSVIHHRHRLGRTAEHHAVRLEYTAPIDGYNGMRRTASGGGEIGFISKTALTWLDSSNGRRERAIVSDDDAGLNWRRCYPPQPRLAALSDQQQQVSPSRQRKQEWRPKSVKVTNTSPIRPGDVLPTDKPQPGYGGMDEWMDSYTATNPAQASQAEPKTPTNSRQPHKTTSCPSVTLTLLGVWHSWGSCPSPSVRVAGHTDIARTQHPSRVTLTAAASELWSSFSPPHRWVSLPGGEMEVGVVSMEEGHSGG